MIKSKRFVTLLCTFFFTLTCALPSAAADIDIGEWNNCDTLFPVLTGDANSNSSIEYIFLKAIYDHPSNRVRLLFMTEQASFPQELTPGVALQVNGGEKIELHMNGNTEYDSENYSAQIVSLSDSRTHTLYLEVTLGIKNGLPEKFILQFQLYDAAGIASNVYTVDLSESEETTTTTTTTQTQSKSKRTDKTKTKTEKTTKKRGTKTTSTKTTAESASTASEISINNAETNSETAPSLGSTKLIGLTAAGAAALAGICTCIVQIFKRSKK